jgi:hypothetical protein
MLITQFYSRKLYTMMTNCENIHSQICLTSLSSTENGFLVLEDIILAALLAVSFD